MQQQLGAEEGGGPSAGRPIRRAVLLGVAFAFACVLVVGLSAWFAIADAYRADETGTPVTGVLPTILIGGVGGIALLTASIWFFTKASELTKKTPNA